MKDIFERDLSGERVTPKDEGYKELIGDILSTIKTATEMNTGYKSPEEVHRYMGEILDKPLPESESVMVLLWVLKVSSPMTSLQ